MSKLRGKPISKTKGVAKARKRKQNPPLQVYDRVAEHNRLNAEREAKGYPPMIEKGTPG